MIRKLYKFLNHYLTNEKRDSELVEESQTGFR